VATLWARRRIADLMSQDLSGAQRGTIRDDLRQQITQLGLDHRLMTQFTSLVAVEETVVTSGGRTRCVQVPVEMPEGVSYDGVGRGQGGGIGSGIGGGVGGGVYRTFVAPTVVQNVPAQPAPAAKAKLDPALAALLDASDKTAKVSILLRDASATTMDRLRQLGVEVLQPGGGLQVAGRIAIEKLAELSNIDAVRYIVRRK
jgi:Ca-activated chloride channel family protein